MTRLMSAPGQGVAQPAIEATTTVRNSGAVAGTEIVQLYIRIRGASVEEPVRVLEGFQRVTLQPGESKKVTFPLGFQELSFINTKSQRVVEPADYTVFIGGSSNATQSADFQGGAVRPTLYLLAGMALGLLVWIGLGLPFLQERGHYGRIQNAHLFKLAVPLRI